LSGLTVGIKDIIDVAGVPTRNGSVAFADARAAAQDAAVVAALRANGARIVGKTVTTEFAFTDPTDCRNPHDSTRSPGGSSSGSGAAVAAGLVDLALGTQTAGSLCRPAAYCGVVGLKPTYGVLPTDGVTPLARSFDSVGVIARSVDVARAAFRAMADGWKGEESGARRAVRWLMPSNVRPALDMAEALDAASEALSELCQMAEAPQLPIDTKTIVQAHRAVMLAEAAEAHGHLLSEPTVGLLRPKFRAGLEAGLRLEESQVDAARQSLHAVARKFWQSMDAVDVILTLPVPEGAPLIGDSTGFQDWLTAWTVFGGPLVSLPWGLDRLGRPCAVMLAGKPGTDMALLNVAERLERLAPVIPAPAPPAA
jgi:Asp-tRNA(Asn)/Glu-tRNA(Gln) amidotransferase A subunit family amidase